MGEDVGKGDVDSNRRDGGEGEDGGLFLVKVVYHI